MLTAAYTLLTIAMTSGLLSLFPIGGMIWANGERASFEAADIFFAVAILLLSVALVTVMGTIVCLAIYRIMHGLL